MSHRALRAASHARASELAALAVALNCTSAGAAVSVELDLSQAEKVLAVIDAGTPGEEQLRQFRADPVTAAVISHGAKFDKRVTHSAWETGLTAAAAKQPVPQDPLRFEEVLARRSECAALLARLRAEQFAVAARVGDALSAYAPAGENFTFRMHAVAGSNSSGWTSDDGKAFYFDVRAAGDDFEGAIALVTHEIYHLVLARLLPQPRLDATSPSGQVERMLINGLDEGMATHVARFDDAGSGRLSRLNRRIASVNEIRAAANFTLFGALLVAASRGEGVSAEDAALIAFSGAYDELGYYLFRDMIRVVEHERGVPALMALVRESPGSLVLAYHQIAQRTASAAAGSVNPRLSAAALQAIARIERERSAKR